MEQTEFTEKQPPPRLMSNEEPLYCDIEDGPHYSNLDTSKMIRTQHYDNKNIISEDVKQNGKTMRDLTFWHPPPITMIHVVCRYQWVTILIMN